MTDDQARALRDLALVALGAVAAFYVIRTPSLRRPAWMLVKYGFTAAPAYLWQETTRAWRDAGESRIGESRIKNPESRIMSM
jgi:hypothetical protein